MTGEHGLWEHARYLTPRPDHGYCTDDNARALIVVCRESRPGPELVNLAGVYLDFIVASALEGGGFRNRRAADGSWVDAVGSDDSQGRALWALGTAARLGPTPAIRANAGDLLAKNGTFRSPALRANAFAMLGAAEVLADQAEHPAARELIERGASFLERAASDDRVWFEPRLSYDNARLPEALIAAGDCLGDGRLLDLGLRRLRWLTEVESGEGHFSFTPVGGWAPGEGRPGFDQQPIEAGAMADACFRAWTITSDPVWQTHLESAARWFLGSNDKGSRVYDPRTGGCCDGLTSSGLNRNLGAESTLSALIALQRWRAASQE